MKILFAADVPPDPDAGASGTEIQTIGALKQIGHEVDTIWSKDLGRIIKHGNAHYLLELPRKYKHAYLSNSERYDVFHFNQPYAWMAARENYSAGSAKPLVIRSHGWEHRAMEELGNWAKRLGIALRPRRTAIIGRMVDTLIRRACRLAARYSSGFVVSSSADRDFIVERYAVDPKNICVASQAAPDNYLNAKPPDMTVERLRNLLAVGPMQIWKGYPFLVVVVNALLKMHQDMVFTWVCPSAVKEKAKALFDHDIRDRVRISERMPQKDLMACYDNAGILLFPSLFEGFGKVPLEAMSRGCCVVSTAVGGVPDYIEDGTSGFIVTPGNAEEMIWATERLMQSLLVAVSVSDAAATQARRFTWKRSATELIDFYESLS